MACLGRELYHLVGCGVGCGVLGIYHCGWHLYGPVFKFPSALGFSVTCVWC